MCFPGGVSPSVSPHKERINTSGSLTMFPPPHSDAESHQGEASESPALVLLVLQLLQGKERLRILLQVLRGPVI